MNIIIMLAGMVLYLVLFLFFRTNFKSQTKKVGKEKLTVRMVVNRMTKIAIFAALSYILYFIKFPLPFFPSFLEINFSMLPIILAGFAFGPSVGVLVVLIRFILKLPFTSTAYVGEMADLLIGISVVLPSSLVYSINKTKKGGVIALIVAVIMWVLSGVYTNYFVNIPFYVEFYFHGDMAPLVGMVKGLYSNVTVDNFMSYYIWLAVIPFNLLLGLVCSTLTYFIYKRISIIFKKDFFNGKKKGVNSK